MLGKSTWAGTVLALAAVAGPVGASPFDVTRLLETGVWHVEHVYNVSEGSAWCHAETWDGDTALSVNGYSPADVELQFYDGAWLLDERRETVRVDLDDQRYWASALLIGSSAFIHLEELGAPFVSDLATKDVVVLHNKDGRRLMTFSLQGAQNALDELAACIDRLGPLGDPLRNVGGPDPF